jgi:hypothetical protein
VRVDLGHDQRRRGGRLGIASCPLIGSMSWSFHSFFAPFPVQLTMTFCGNDEITSGLLMNFRVKYVAERHLGKAVQPIGHPAPQKLSAWIDDLCRFLSCVSLRAPPGIFRQCLSNIATAAPT